MPGVGLGLARQQRDGQGAEVDGGDDGWAERLGELLDRAE
jgi:hypothetical protein